MELLSPSDFRGETLRRKGRFAVVFAADWCPFCRAFLPKFARLEGDPKFTAARVDLTDFENPLWETFRIEVVPSVLVFRDGEIVLRIDGTSGVGLDDRDVAKARAAASE